MLEIRSCWQNAIWAGYDGRLSDRWAISAGVMLTPTEITTLEFQWIKMPYDYVAVLNVEFNDLPGADDCYWIRLYRNGQPYSWDLVDKSFASEGIVSEAIMTSRRRT